MKHFIYLLAVCLVSICFSCSNDTFTLDEPTSQSLKMQNDSIRTLRYCYGCLPMITAYHDPSFNEFTVAWSGFGASPISHPVTISLNADGRSKSQTITNANGTIKLSIYSSSYTGSWSVSCSSYDCSSCKNSGSILKKESGEIETDIANACYKDYLNYTVERVYNTDNYYDLILNDFNGDLNNTEKYMTIDRAKAYLIDSYSGYEQEISGASLDMSSAPYRIRLYLSRQDMNKRFRIKFFSSRCQHSREHYLYTNYYFDGFGAQLSTYLDLAKAH